MLLGRFTAALRVLIPGLAGMAGLDYRRFAAYNAAGGALWATGFVLLGYAAGSGWRRVERIAGRASLILLLMVGVVAAVALGARWIANHPDRVRALTERQLERPWVRWFRGRYQRQLAFLARRLQPGGALGLSLTASIVVLVAAGWAFGALLQDVVAHDELALLDGPVQRFFVAHREAWLTPPMRAITNLGNAALLIGIVLAVGLVWGWKRHTWRPLALLTAAYAGAWVLSNTVKTLSHRPRPPAAQAIGRWTGYAFPSGHATHATAVYGMLAALLAAATPSWTRKVTWWTAAVLLVGLVGLSRLYLGAHWLTDVLAGFALGGAWLFAVLSAARTVDALRRQTAASCSPPGGGRADRGPEAPPVRRRLRQRGPA